MKTINEPEYVSFKEYQKLKNNHTQQDSKGELSSIEVNLDKSKCCNSSKVPVEPSCTNNCHYCEKDERFCEPNTHAEFMNLVRKKAIQDKMIDDTLADAKGRSSLLLQQKSSSMFSDKSSQVLHELPPHSPILDAVMIWGCVNAKSIPDDRKFIELEALKQRIIHMGSKGKSLLDLYDYLEGLTKKESEKN